MLGSFLISWRISSNGITGKVKRSRKEMGVWWTDQSNRHSSINHNVIYINGLISKWWSKFCWTGGRFSSAALSCTEDLPRWIAVCHGWELTDCCQLIFRRMVQVLDAPLMWKYDVLVSKTHPNHSDNQSSIMNHDLELTTMIMVMKMMKVVTQCLSHQHLLS